jgi:site-specific recombinase
MVGAAIAITRPRKQKIYLRHCAASTNIPHALNIFLHLFIHSDETQLLQMAPEDWLVLVNLMSREMC